VVTGRKPSIEDLDLAAAVWRKASASDNQGECVRVARHDAYTLLDDSKRPASITSDALVLAPAEWRAFRSSVVG
jgi:hypothetical protein